MIPANICKGCKSRVEKGRKYILGSGNPRAKFLILGEAPGRTENDRGVPFIGQTGTLLKRKLRDIGGTPLLNQCYFSNAVKVWPGEGNPTPSMEWMRECNIHCNPWLIEAVQPEVVICVGAAPLKQMTDDGNIALVRNRRRVFWYQWGDKQIPVVATWHPSAVARSTEKDGLDEWWDSDLYSYLVEEEYKREPAVVPFKKDTPFPERYIGQKLYFDIETTGLDRHKDTVRCVGLGNGSSVYVNRDEESYDTIRQTLFTPESVLVGANLASFDIPFFLEDREIPTCRAVDVQYLHYLVDERYPIRGLKHLALLYTPYAEFDLPKGGVDYPISQVMPYNAADVKFTEWVEKGVRQELSDLRVNTHRWERVVERIIPVLAGMTRTGIPINRELLQEVSDSERKKWELAVDLMKAIWESHSEEPWDMGNLDWRKLQVFLYDVLKLPGPKIKDPKLKNGKYTTRKEALEWHRDNETDTTGFIKALFLYRDHHENWNKYVQDFLKRAANTGRINPQYNLLSRRDRGAGGGKKGVQPEGTLTGRLSITKPAVHNVPRGHPMRRAICPLPGDSHIVQIDLSQIELVLLAQLSGDRDLQKIFRTGDDLHQWCADLATSYGYPITRQSAKTVNFGILYGVGPKGLASQTPLDVDGAVTVMKAWGQKFPGVGKFREQVERQALTRCYVEAAHGQRRNFKKGIKKWSKEGGNACRQAFNFCIQSVANAINLMILVDWVDAGHHEEWGFPLFLTHDDIKFSTNDTDHVLSLMSDYYRFQLRDRVEWLIGQELRVPICAEAKVGPNWGEMEEVCKFEAAPV